MQNRDAPDSSMPGGVVVAQRTLAPLTEVRILAGQLHILSLCVKRTCLLKRSEARSVGPWRCGVKGVWNAGEGGEVAGAAGLEPATLGFGDRCSTKLSYAPANLFELDRQAELRFCQCLSDLGGYPALECVPHNLIQSRLKGGLITIAPSIVLRPSLSCTCTFPKPLDEWNTNCFACLKTSQQGAALIRLNCNSWLARSTSDG